MSTVRMPAFLSLAMTLLTPPMIASAEDWQSHVFCLRNIGGDALNLKFWSYNIPVYPNDVYCEVRKGSLRSASINNQDLNHSTCTKGSGMSVNAVTVRCLVIVGKKGECIPQVVDPSKTVNNLEACFK
jgi:hypothetical protein